MAIGGTIGVAPAPAPPPPDIADSMRIIKEMRWHPQAAKTQLAYYRDGDKIHVLLSEKDRSVGQSLKKVLGARVVLEEKEVQLFSGSPAADQSPHWGGAHLTNGAPACTSGFTMKLPNGDKAALTAAHCGNDGDAFVSGNIFYGAADKPTAPSHDAMLVRDPGEDYENRIHTGLNGSRRVTEKGDPQEGDSVCLSGMISGEKCSGTVHKMSDVTFHAVHPDGTVTHIDDVIGISADPSDLPLAQRGDSGAPLYSNGPSGQVKAHGMVIGGTNDGSYVFAEKISHIESTTGASIDTEDPTSLNRHQLITIRALGCHNATQTSDSNNNCFEPKSLMALAGRPNAASTGGAVTEPDYATSGFLVKHCHNADYLDTPDYVISRSSATTALLACINNMRSNYSHGAMFAKDMIDFPSGGAPALESSAKDCFGVSTVSSKCDTITKFGAALNGIHDFYSHSNFTDDPLSVDVDGVPGLGGNAPSSLLRFNQPAPTSSAVPEELTTECYSSLASDCESRVSYDTLNKDSSDNIPVNPGQPVGEGSTQRGSVHDNFAKSVNGAVAETQAAWADFKVKLNAEHGEIKGNTLACILTHDNAAKCVYDTYDDTGIGVLYKDENGQYHGKSYVSQTMAVDYSANKCLTPNCGGIGDAFGYGVYQSWLQARDETHEEYPDFTFVLYMNAYDADSIDTYLESRQAYIDSGYFNQGDLNPKWPESAAAKFLHWGGFNPPGADEYDCMPTATPGPDVLSQVASQPAPYQQQGAKAWTCVAD
ncbi:S1 family peptidase [Streptomyces sp. NPDC053431]|uniref:S1 family peptidase n=1 Tax=Streptomyces sp. NPDC053431 TaxID=3365703 RepID=UPI0037CF2BBB